MKRLFLFISLFLIITGAAANGQNKYIPPDPYTQWDGITHKSRYMIIAPAYLGPNALSVPLLHNARVPEEFFWTGMYEFYHNPGDRTHDFYTRIMIPMAGGRVGLEMKYVPVELYTTDSATSRYRRTLSGREVESWSLGDFYFSTMIQLIRDHQHLPDIAFSMSCRTASGTGRDDARHTDMPGYYFDLSVGKSHLKQNGFFRSLRWYGEVGFYVWQTYLDNYPQNDALLYGAGIDVDFAPFFINQSLRGYNGYMNNGDHPLVYRADLGIKIGSARMVAGIEKGLRDYPFTGFRTGFEINGFSE